jgi:hypothetical protein
MSQRKSARQMGRGWAHRLALCASAVALLGTASSAMGQDSDAAVDQVPTATPIKHVIVLIGENWSFDSLYQAAEKRSVCPIYCARARLCMRASGLVGGFLKLGGRTEQLGDADEIVGGQSEGE